MDKNELLKLQQAPNKDDATKFCEELKKLMEKYVTDVGYNCVGVTRLWFKDGSRIGTLRILKNMGIIVKYPDE